MIIKSLRVSLLVLAAVALALGGCGGSKKKCIDEDGDGYGLNCDLGLDCRDADADVNPGATEVCDNNTDDDCDGETDEDCDDCVDADNDTYGDNCAAGDDCDDGDATINPGAQEYCNGIDDDCDGATDEDDVCDDCHDADMDNYEDAECGGDDCDDANPAVYPGATEVCNQVDDDCDGQTDEDDVCPVCTDEDSDGYGPGCAAGADCDDSDADINPDAVEACDGVDNDCDDQTDEDGVCPDCVDNDGDTFGDNCPAGADCDDDDAEVNPDATENPRNNKDDNCNDQTDEATASPFAADLVFNEILVDGNTDQDANGDGDIDATDDEFVEIANVSQATIDLAGWSLWDADQATARHIFQAGTTLPADEVVVVFGGGSAPDDIAGATFMVAWNFDPGVNFGLGLNNGGDELTLYDDQMREVLVFAYGEGEVIAPIQDESITRNPDVTGDFAAHTDAAGDPGVIFSPGTKVDGSNFP